MTLQILTANRLSDGRVVYFTAVGAWSEDLADGALGTDESVAAALTVAGQQAVAARQVVDPYLIEVRREPDGRVLPLRLRECIRAAGPSVRPDLARGAPGAHRPEA